VFTDRDFSEYYKEVGKILRDCLSIYTDLINQLDNRAIKSRLTVVTTECLEAYEFILQQAAAHSGKK